MVNDSGNPTLIQSEFADDPDMRELVQEYVSKMPTRIEQMTAAFERGEREQLIRLAHQLKGSGGGYGFQMLTVAAERLEQDLHRLGDGDLSEARACLSALIDVCGRIAA